MTMKTEQTDHVINHHHHEEEEEWEEEKQHPRSNNNNNNSSRSIVFERTTSPQQVAVERDVVGRTVMSPSHPHPHHHPRHSQSNSTPRKPRRKQHRRKSSLSVVSFLAISISLSFVGTIGQIWIWTLQQRSLSMLSSIIVVDDNIDEMNNPPTLDFDTTAIAKSTASTTAAATNSSEPLQRVVEETAAPSSLRPMSSSSSTVPVPASASATSGGDNTQAHATPIITTTTNDNDDTDNSNRAIFVISMGITASKTHFVERFVYSARTQGRYDGWIVLLTDAPATRYEKLKQWNYHDDKGHDGQGGGDEKFIIIHPKPEHYNSQFKFKDMTIKRFKTYVIDYIDMLSSSPPSSSPAEEDTNSTTKSITPNVYKEFQKVELIYYLDVDIVFAGPLSIVFNGLEQKYKIGASHNTNTNSNSTNAVMTKPIPHKSKIWMFEGNFKNAPIQGGQMVLDRRQSLGCLDKWRKMIDKGAPNVKKDQLPLMGMYHSQLGRMKKNKKNKKKKKGMQQTNKNETKYLEPLDCFIVKMDQKPYISFPEKEDVKDRAKELSSSSSSPADNGSASNATASSSFVDSVSHHNHRYTNMVHVRNTAGIGMHLEDDIHKIWLKDVLDMKPNDGDGDDEDDDPLGILEPGHMKARRKDQVAASS